MDKERAGVIGAIFLVLLLVVHAIERWTVVDAVLNGIRGWGTVGIGISGFLTSPVVPLVVALTVIVLYFEGRQERKSKKWGIFRVCD